MSRFYRLGHIGTLLALLNASPVFAAPLTVTKTSQVVSDPLLELLPKAIPGAEVDYTITVTNPASNVTTSVAKVTFSDTIPANTRLKVADYALLNPGPVSFGAGLSLLTYSFAGFDSDADSLSFSSDNGVSWTYRPVADADGYDARVTNIRVVAGGAQLVGTSFSITFRVKVK